MRYSLIVLIFLLTSCSLHKETQDKALLYYGKTACLGKCPVYDLHVFGNGKVIYYGVDNVKVKGWHISKVSKEVLQKIKEVLSTMKFKSDEKRTRDIPNTIIVYKNKKISTQDRDQVLKIEKILKNLIPT
jgi:hypothetical protein